MLLLYMSLFLLLRVGSILAQLPYLELTSARKMDLHDDVCTNFQCRFTLLCTSGSNNNFRPKCFCKLNHISCNTTSRTRNKYRFAFFYLAFRYESSIAS